MLPSALISEIKENALFQAKSLLEGSAKEEIVKYANKCHADLVVVGSHGKTNLQRMLLGSVFQTVCAAAPCSVLIVK